MKKRNARIILSVLVAMLLLLSTACGASVNQTASGPSAASTAASATAQTTAAQAAAPDPFGKYSPAIDIEAVNTQIDPDYKIPNGDTPDNNIWTRYYKDNLGINVTLKWYTSADKAMDKTNLMIASGDFPDLFYVNPTQFVQLRDAGQLADLTDVYANYSSPAFKGFVEADGGTALNSAKKDGKIYGIPNYFDWSELSNMVYIRADWLKKLNLPDPKTAQDLFNIAAAFVKDKPDGKPDTYGINFFQYGTNPAFYNMFHAYPTISGGGAFTGQGMWLKDPQTGKLVDGLVGNDTQAAATKAALAKLAEFYKEGIVAKDFGVKDGAKLVEDLQNGKCGVDFSGLWEAYGLQPGHDKNPNMQWKAFPIMSVDDKPALLGLDPFTMMGYYVMKKDTKHPEALIKLMNVFVKLAGDGKTAEAQYADSSTSSFKGAVALMWPPKGNYALIQRFLDAYKTKSDASLFQGDKVTYNQIMDYINKGDNSQWANYVSYGPDGSSCQVMLNYVQNNLIMKNEFTGLPTQSTIEKGPIIKKAWDEMMTKVVMTGDLTLFDKFVQQYKTLGGDAITKEVNDWYTAHQN